MDELCLGVTALADPRPCLGRDVAALGGWVIRGPSAPQHASRPALHLAVAKPVHTLVASCNIEASYPLQPVHLGLFWCSNSVFECLESGDLSPLGNSLAIINWYDFCQVTLWPFSFKGLRDL